MNFFINPNEEPVNPQNHSTTKSNGDDTQLYSLPFEKIVAQIGDYLSQPEYAEFAETLNEAIKSSLENMFKGKTLEFTDENDYLADLINKIIQQCPDLFDQLKGNIEQMFNTNNQFQIPQ